MNKKGQLKAGAVVVFLILAISLLLIVPPIVSNTNAQGTNSCPNTNASLVDLNLTIGLCVLEAEATHKNNETPLFTNTVPQRERTVLSLVVIFLFLGLVFFIAKKTGLIGKGE